jgi:hypothetical protein
MAGAPLGNKNAANAKRWAAAIERALTKRGKGDSLIALDDLAEKLLKLCEQADLAALKEFGDRIDGKPSQAIVGEADRPLEMKVTWKK